jgi:hypothetical protein
MIVIKRSVISSLRRHANVERIVYDADYFPSVMGHAVAIWFPVREANDDRWLKENGTALVLGNEHATVFA